MGNLELLAAGAIKIGLGLTSEQLEQFNRFYQELISWNRKINLTAIVDFDEVQLKHFLDSLTIMLAFDNGLVFNRQETRLIDIGAGAGMPGLPLKIAFPALKLTLLESVFKKVAFLKFVTDTLKLSDVEVIYGRAEEVAHRPEYRERFDIAVSRGIGRLAEVAELCLPFCRNGGWFIAPKKGDVEEEIEKASFAIAALGGQIEKVKKVEVPEFKDNRLLVVVKKISTTPDKYPRRAGMPAKRPLLARN